MWVVLYIFAGGILVAYFRRGPNAVWGGATLGLLAGGVWALVAGMEWINVLRGVTLGTILGFVFELLFLFKRNNGSSD